MVVLGKERSRFIGKKRETRCLVLTLLCRAPRTKNKDWLGDEEDGREGRFA